MILCDAPSRGGLVRLATLGSCRVRNPMTALRDAGALRIRAEGPTPTHTAEEAMQALAHVRGELSYPPGLLPYIFEADEAPSLPRLAEALAGGVDSFILEISDDKQFVFGDYYLNQNFVTRRLVKPTRGALLDWYREISRGKIAGEDTVEIAMGRLAEVNGAVDPLTEALLRSLHVTRRDPSRILETVRTMIERHGGRWVLVGPFVIPGDESEVMGRRAAFNRALVEIAETVGARFFDASALIARHGAAVALAGGGADIYEYNDSFYPILGRALVTAACEGAVPRTHGEEDGAPRGTAVGRLVDSGAAFWLQAKARSLAKLARRVSRRLRPRSSPRRPAT